MSDRELLEAAARAAGFVVRRYIDSYDDYYWYGPDSGLEVEGMPGVWNPLTDDGAALRLAVKLRISLDHNRAGDQQLYVVAERPGCEGCFAPVCCVQDDMEDEAHRPSATRRAIVRAAAEIERAMK